MNYDIIVVVGFNKDQIINILNYSKKYKVVIFDYNENIRTEFEKLHEIYKDRITFYEGDVKLNLISYYKLRKKENIKPIKFINL